MAQMLYDKICRYDRNIKKSVSFTEILCYTFNVCVKKQI